MKFNHAAKVNNFQLCISISRAPPNAMHIPNQELKLVPMLRSATFLSLVLPLLSLHPLLPIKVCKKKAFSQEV
jgi:hypothetical protein